MSFSLVGQLPRHLYVFVDSSFTHKEPIGFIPAVWFGLVSVPGRMWGCTVMLESGAIYRNLPPHAIAFRPDAAEFWLPQEAQRWDCYGERFTTVEYSYLSGLDVRAICNEGDERREIVGEYLFTVAPIGDGFSLDPSQAKEFTFVKLGNGRLTIQPTNYVLFQEKSFTTNPGFEWPTGLKRQTEIWNCE